MCRMPLSLCHCTPPKFSRCFTVWVFSAGHQLKIILLGGGQYEMVRSKIFPISFQFQVMTFPVFPKKFFFFVSESLDIAGGGALRFPPLFYRSFYACFKMLGKSVSPGLLQLISALIFHFSSKFVQKFFAVCDFPQNSQFSS